MPAPPDGTEGSARPLMDGGRGGALSAMGVLASSSAARGADFGGRGRVPREIVPGTFGRAFLTVPTDVQRSTFPALGIRTYSPRVLLGLGRGLACWSVRFQAHSRPNALARISRRFLKRLRSTLCPPFLVSLNQLRQVGCFSGGPDEFVFQQVFGCGSLKVSTQCKLVYAPLEDRVEDTMRRSRGTCE